MESSGVNPFIDTEDDHLSTFALDVDTGSYTIARRYVTDGNLPPEDAVRVEEFVNYFDQDCAYPPEGQAFAIHVDGASFPFAETERYRMIRIGIQGYAVPAEERKDVSLTFVIDVSGSMDMENRLELVKRSLELLVEQLRPTDAVGIVVYGSEARVVLEPTSGAEKGAILEAIYALHPEGSTNAEAGLRLGYQQALSGFKPDGINRVILCSDGVANVGNTGAGSIWEAIKGYASEGVTLTTVGFGMGNYNDVLMEQLADNGDGFYAYVDTLKEAERLFVENLTSTLQVIAMDAKVQVDFNPEVVARPGDLGFDVLHYNLHKTFSTPHGGGGPGSGPVGAAPSLADFLPGPIVAVDPERSDEEGPFFTFVFPAKSIGRVKGFYGHFGVLVRAYTYIRMLGPDGLRRVAEHAVLNANYLMSRVKDTYRVPYDRICMHEFVLAGPPEDVQAAGVHTMDVAKRLMDFGFHPPTVYFPLIVPEALMIEPTETESNETLDEFAEALLSIAEEARTAPDLLHDAPHNAPVRRLDEVRAAKELILRWEPE